MIEYIFVMMLWIGDSHGGPTIINGFSSMETCNQAIEILKKEDNVIWYGRRYYKCIQLPK